MTNWWADTRNTKMAVVWGGNPAENHPGVMQWLNEAVDNGADVLVIDPRKTRTAVWAERRGGMYVAIRPGTDGALGMGIINYAITNGRVDYDYLYNFTDAAFGVSGDPFGSGGCGYTRATGTTQKRPTHKVDGSCFGAIVANSETAPTAFVETSSAQPWVWGGAGSGQAYVTESGTVFDYLATRASGYTASVVADICGITVAEFNALADLWTSHMAKDGNPAALYYAMGGTQHTTAGQQLHLKCILQLLLGNVGRSGSGINALRGIHNVQGSTDMGVLRDSLIGYSDSPDLAHTYAQYLDVLFGNDTGTGLQQRGYRNMLYWYFRQDANPGTGSKATPGTAASAGHNLMPRRTDAANPGGFQHVQMFQKMQASGSGAVNALYVLGQNPVVTEPNVAQIKAGLDNIDLLVCQDMYLNETAKYGCGGRTWLLPSCAHPEEAGSVTSSSRMFAWRYKACDTKGNSRQDLEILLRLASSLAATGAFSHIPVVGGFSDIYQQLYGDSSQYGWTPGVSSSFNTKVSGKYVGERVAEDVYKQMAGWASHPTTTTPAPGVWGTLWIYQYGYVTPSDDQSIAGGTGAPAAATASPHFGTQLTHDVTAGATTAYVAGDCAASAVTGGPGPSGMPNFLYIPTGTKVILGQYGMHGAKESNWPDGGMQTRGYDSKATKVGGNEEEVTITGVTAYPASGTSRVEWSSGVAQFHASGEPFTGKGYYSYHAQDGILAKSRATYDPGANGLFPRFGWAWLFNRRNFYNMNPCGGTHKATQKDSVVVARGGSRYSPGHVTYCETCTNNTNGSCLAVGDVADYFVKADGKATLFVPQYPTDTGGAGSGTYGMNTQVYAGDDGFAWPRPQGYRKYNSLKEVDVPASGTDWTLAASTKYSNVPSRYPKHWEPIETPRQDLRAEYGSSILVKPTLAGGSSSTAANALDAAIGSVSDYPLVLTTGRICWHFQGGPLSRNNPWLCELDSDPYIILNAVDARTYGNIKDGDDVMVYSHRYPGGSGPYKAKVGVGAQSTQNVKQGVAWLPWHWGDAGLQEGACANELTIDALDSNSLIPESKACLCRIAKA